MSTTFEAPSLPPERLLEMIRGVVDDCCELEPLPHRPGGMLSARDLETAPPDDSAAMATKRWQLHATDVTFRNRRQLQSLLWACRVLRDTFGDTEHFAELGTPLTHALIRSGWRQDVPSTHAGIIAAVRAWVPPSRAGGLR